MKAFEQKPMTHLVIFTLNRSTIQIKFIIPATATEKLKAEQVMSYAVTKDHRGIL